MPAAPLYDPGATHVLSDDARAKAEQTQDAHAVIAETLLGLRETNYTGDAADQAAMAVALQVNYQVARPAAFATFLEEEVKGSQRRRFRTFGSESERRALLDPIASSIVDRLAAEHQSDSGWATLTSKR